jgi:hypothetical protein
VERQRRGQRRVKDKTRRRGEGTHINEVECFVRVMLTEIEFDERYGTWHRGRR